jgi:hypothetical protein
MKTRKRCSACVIATVVILGFALLVLSACCCVHGGHGRAASSSPVAPVPAIGTVDIPMPSEAAAKAPTEVQMVNVWFRLDPILFLDIHSLRGQMVAKEPGAPVNFDDKTTFIMRIDRAVIGMNPASLDRLMNGYVFGYPNAPLRELHTTIEGAQILQEGIIHKGIDMPFTMWADVSASGGLIRIHPTKIEICGINGALLKVVGMTLERMLKMPVARGVRAEKNDLLLDPEKVLPPPQAELHLVDVRVANGELLQTYDAGRHLPPLVAPDAAEKNYMYFRGGTLRMGKLLMVDAALQIADADPSDPLDFYLDRYNDQLVAGYTRNQSNYGLLVFMRDFAALGQPRRPGERLAPK